MKQNWYWLISLLIVSLSFSLSNGTSSFERYELCPIFAYAVNNPVITWSSVRDKLFSYAKLSNQPRIIRDLLYAEDVTNDYTETQKYQILWTGDNGLHQLVNEGLRDCKKMNLIFQVSILPFAVGLKKTCKKEYDNLTLYRGLHSQNLTEWQERVNGEVVFEEKGFLSTTITHSMAEKFACQRGSYGVVLTLNGVCYGCQPESLFEDESEILLQPNQWIRCYEMTLLPNRYKKNEEMYAEISCIFEPYYLQYN